MGLGSETEGSPTEEAINAQLAETKAELEQKKQSLFETRFNIIKAQGGQAWSPSVGQYAPRSPAKKGGGGNFPDWTKNL